MHETTFGCSATATTTTTTTTTASQARASIMITYYMRHAARASCSSVRCSSGTHPLHQMSGPIRVVDAIIVNFTFYPPPYSRRILVAPKGHYCCCCVALLVHLRCVKMFPGIANYTRRPKRASLLLLCCVAGTPQVLQNIPGNRIIMNKAKTPSSLFEM